MTPELLFVLAVGIAATVLLAAVLSRRIIEALSLVWAMVLVAGILVAGKVRTR